MVSPSSPTTRHDITKRPTLRAEQLLTNQQSRSILRRSVAHPVANSPHMVRRRLNVLQRTCCVQGAHVTSPNVGTELVMLFLMQNRCKLNSHRHQYNIKIISIIHNYTTIISTWLSHDTSVAWSWDTGMELGGPHVHAHWDESVSKQPNAGHQQWGSSMRIRSRKKHKKTLDFGTK